MAQKLVELGKLVLADDGRTGSLPSSWLRPLPATHNVGTTWAPLPGAGSRRSSLHATALKHVATRLGQLGDPAPAHSYSRPSGFTVSNESGAIDNPSETICNIMADTPRSSKRLGRPSYLVSTLHRSVLWSNSKELSRYKCPLGANKKQNEVHHHNRVG